MTIELNDEKTKDFYMALKPEIDSVPYKKTRTTISMDGENTLVIVVEGKDIGAIRGTFNSYLNWLKIIDENLEI